MYLKSLLLINFWFNKRLPYCKSLYAYFLVIWLTIGLPFFIIFGLITILFMFLNVRVYTLKFVLHLQRDTNGIQQNELSHHKISGYLYLTLIIEEWCAKIQIPHNQLIILIQTIQDLIFTNKMSKMNTLDNYIITKKTKDIPTTNNHKNKSAKELSQRDLSVTSKENLITQLDLAHQYCQNFLLITPEDLATKQKDLEALKKLVGNSKKQNIIQFIRQRICKIYKITKLQYVKVELLQQISSVLFWENAIPMMLNSILTEKIQRISLLIQNKNSIVQLNRRQVYLLLCHMFFCTLPQQIHTQIIWFNYLYTGTKSRRPQVRLQKLKCIINYFQQMLNLRSDQWKQIIIYQRKYIQNFIFHDRKMCDVQLTVFNIQQHKGQLNIDFANKAIGGGVLKDGAVQQEILFIIHPQLIVSILLASGPLTDNQAIVILGYNQFSRYQGYSNDFKFKEKFYEFKTIDSFNKNQNVIIAIDAFDFNNNLNSNQMQFKEYYVNRQIHKAYVGFNIDEWVQEDNQQKKRIITGKWGCGAFKGNVDLKFIIQWISCTYANRDMVFVNWDSSESNIDKTQKKLKQIIQYLKQFKVSEVRMMLRKYVEFQRRENIEIELFEYILEFYN